MKKMSDRRKHPRKEPWETTVVFWKNDSINGIGKLLNISRGGLAIKIFADESLSGSFEIEIFNTAADFHINNLPVTVVTEKVNGKESSSMVESFKEYSFLFHRMSLDQAFDMEKFIREHTRENELKGHTLA